MLNRIQLISLRTRAIIFVTLAMLPLGLIALWQTDIIIEDQRQASQRGLLALTEKAAVRERQIIERAIGGAAALATTAHALTANPELCQTVLRRFVRSSTLYGFVSFHRAGGGSSCASVPTDAVPPGNEALQRLKDERIIGIYRDNEDDNTGAPALIVATPVFENAVYQGHLQLHVNSGAFRPDSDAISGERPTSLITFNASGNILTSEAPADTARMELPENTSLAELSLPEQVTFEAQAQNGELRRFAVLPLIPGTVYVLAAWPVDLPMLQVNNTYWRTSLLAGTMWLASVVTVYLVMHLLVIKGLNNLHGQMSRFALQRTLPAGNIMGRGELFDMEENFRTLAETVVKDEAELEDSVREKNVLLKEVHHRVKNNLQLINSIMNMLLRGNPSEETRRVVRRLQDRVMALASVHRLIYQAQSMEQVDAAPIIREVVDQSVALGLAKESHKDIELSLGRVVLYPDQALPLTMLVSEAITNAIKYAGESGLTIRVSLSLREPSGSGEAAIGELVVTNSIGAANDNIKGTALGAKLMRAFTMQLGGEMTTKEKDGVYQLRITFPVEDFSPDAEDTMLTREEAAA